MAGNHQTSIFNWWALGFQVDGMRWVSQKYRKKVCSQTNGQCKSIEGRKTKIAIFENPHLSWKIQFQENYNTPRYRTPQAIPLANYERNPIIACW